MAFEGGITLRDEQGTLQLLGFHQRLRDAVVRVRSGGLFRRVNQEGQQSSGIELAGSHRTGWFTFGAGLIGQSVRLLDPDAGLERPENVPEWSGSLHAEATLPRAFGAGALARYTGDQYAIHPDLGSLARLPARQRRPRDDPGLARRRRRLVHGPAHADRRRERDRPGDL